MQHFSAALLSLGVSCPLGQPQLGWRLLLCPPRCVSDLILSSHSGQHFFVCVVVSNDILLEDQELLESGVGGLPLIYCFTFTKASAWVQAGAQ